MGRMSERDAGTKKICVRRQVKDGGADERTKVDNEVTVKRKQWVADSLISSLSDHHKVSRPSSNTAVSKLRQEVASP
jgi:hypothetical protein